MELNNECVCAMIHAQPLVEKTALVQAVNYVRAMDYLVLVGTLFYSTFKRVEMTVAKKLNEKQEGGSFSSILSSLTDHNNTNKRTKTKRPFALCS